MGFTSTIVSYGVQVQLISLFASYSLYFLLFSHEPELPSSIQCDVMELVNLDDPNMWFQVCEQQVSLFQWVMAMTRHLQARVDQKQHDRIP